MPNTPNAEKKTLILTGASRGIGHATVKRFASAGWRVITCSRYAFPENCPWEMGPEDHIQVDLANAGDTARAIGEMRLRLAAQGSRLNALVNNAGISPKGAGGSRRRVGYIAVVRSVGKQWSAPRLNHLAVVKHPGGVRQGRSASAPAAPLRTKRHLPQRPALTSESGRNESSKPAGASNVLPAIDLQLDAVHIARLLGAQEVDGLRYFLGLTQTSQRDLLMHDLVGPR